MATRIGKNGKFHSKNKRTIHKQDIILAAYTLQILPYNVLLWILTNNMLLSNNLHDDTPYLDDIKQIILGTASPLVAGHPKPKFSLRMSAQLMFGLIKIYKRQLFFIYDDICHLISRLSAQKFLQVAANIDLNIEAKAEMVNRIKKACDFLDPSIITQFYTQSIYGNTSHVLNKIRALLKGDTVTLKNPLEHPDELNPEFGQMGQDTSSVMLGYSQSHYFNVPSNPELDLTSETQEATTDNRVSNVYNCSIIWIVAPEKDSLVAPEWEITIREDDNPAIPADVPLRDEYLNVNQLFPEPADSTLFSLYEIPQITISVPEEEVAVHRGDVTPCVMPEAVLPAVPSKKDSRLQEDLDETLIEQPVPGQTHRSLMSLAVTTQSGNAFQLLTTRSPKECFLILSLPRFLASLKLRSPLASLELYSLQSTEHVIRSRRHKLIIDKETQLSKNSIWKNIDTSDMLCLDHPMKLVQRSEPNDNDDPYRLLFPDEYSSSETSGKNNQSVSSVEEEREQFRPASEQSETNLEMPLISELISTMNRKYSSYELLPWMSCCKPEQLAAASINSYQPC
ncbi:Meiotic recombination protein REC8 [Nymphon striatum]|nr:Meiotic recombination protein REC8 [Nymphon striatum]